MKGLLVRIARGLNRLWNRRGSVLDDHYHARALKTPREVRNALVYVLQNARKHGVRMNGADPCSSGVSFDGWTAMSHAALAKLAAPIARARSWLLSVGWRKHGRIALNERPAETAGFHGQRYTRRGGRIALSERPALAARSLSRGCSPRRR
jgi:hypothetical protein